MDHQNSQWLPVYLRTQMAQATAGVALFGYVASSHRDEEVRAEVAWLGTQVQQDRDSLREVMGDLGVRQASVDTLTAHTGSPLAANDVGLETLTAAVQSKILLWESLLELAERDTRLDPHCLRTLHDRATAQRETLIELDAGPVRTPPVRAMVRTRNTPPHTT